MSLNQEGIAQLKADLRANAKHYNQQNFGVVTSDCGAEACMAGMCLMHKIGLEDFTKSIKDFADPGFYRFVDDCVWAGAAQLGIAIDSECYGGSDVPPIFEKYENWPPDLSEAFHVAENKHDHEAMAELACAALDRIDENGCFIGFDGPDEGEVY